MRNDHISEVVYAEIKYPDVSKNVHGPESIVSDLWQQCRILREESAVQQVIVLTSC